MTRDLTPLVSVDAHAEDCECGDCTSGFLEHWAAWAAEESDLPVGRRVWP